MNARPAVLVALLLAPSAALAQDASVATDASRPAAPAPARAAGRVRRRPAPGRPRARRRGHGRSPATRSVGDRVRVTYRFRYRTHDRVEFEPDAVALQQPAIELEYAREQPERDRSVHGERRRAPALARWSSRVQPFSSGDVVDRARRSRG